MLMAMERIRTIVKDILKQNLTSTYRRKFFRFFLMMICVCSFYSSANIRINAKEAESPSAHEIVVVIDCSKSMEDADGGYVAFDFVKSLSAILPRDYRLGVIAYNNEVCVNLPLGSSYTMIENKLSETEYAGYGNAGAGLAEAVTLFDDEDAAKRIVMISDGEIMMKTEEGTQESVNLYTQAIEDARTKGIAIDVIALGPQIEEGYTVYSAADSTGGQLYEQADGGELGDFTEELLFGVWKLNAVHVGKMDGLSGELSVRLPDCLMSKAKVILLGNQQNENMTVNCEADRINVSKGTEYTVIELLEPGSDEIKIQMMADSPMDISAYLTAEYDLNVNADYTYVPEEQTADIRLEITNQNGQNMLEGHLKDGGTQVYLNGDKQTYKITDEAFCIARQYEQDATAHLRAAFDGLYGNYYGDMETEVSIVVPVVEEEPPKIDWFFWSVIIVFAAALTIIFCLSYRQRKRTVRKSKFIDESRMLPREKANYKSEFQGKLQVYVIHNKDDIDYPPESINLFARCTREMITLEWILDICNLPLNLRGAERIIIRPGDDRSLIIKNNSKAAVLMGRELLLKGHAYHLYYGEKVTFIFDEEDAEIEVHYRDLKPNER